MAESLSKSKVERYSRQLILSDVGPSGQLSLGKSRVLIVGAGGLGCPVGIYLAGAGVGHIGIVDYDTVDISNLHRQVAYQESFTGQSKAIKLSETILALNSELTCEAYVTLLNSLNALEIISDYHIVVDATDNVATRYLLNDACVLSKKPLVSGSALRFDGQLTVYNYQDGPCYRCLFPEPPPAETVTNCSDGGVLGPIPGVIGNLQALETIKIITGMEPSYSGKLLLFDGRIGSFRIIKLRKKQENCLVCGLNPTIIQLIDYTQFCGSSATDKTPSLNILDSEERVTCEEYQNLVKENIPHLLLDVRPKFETEICRLPNSYCFPFEELKMAEILEKLKIMIMELKEDESAQKNVFVVCRRGNNSQMAVKYLKDLFKESKVVIKDLIGGLYSHAMNVDLNFPVY